MASVIEKLRAGIIAVEELIHDSLGVAGLHRNGDVATWEELRTGGRFEEWLKQFDEALEVCRTLEEQERGE